MQDAHLLGALIGFANTAGDHENILTEDMHALVRKALLCENADDVQPLIDRIRAAKHMLSPSCAACSHPCGRTSDFDMELLSFETPDTQIMKKDLIRRLCTLAALPPEESVQNKIYQGLRAVSEYRSDESLQRFLANFH